jgi:hypothetical protein
MFLLTFAAISGYYSVCVFCLLSPHALKTQESVGGSSKSIISFLSHISLQNVFETRTAIDQDSQA